MASVASKSNGLESSDWARAPVNSGPAWQRILWAIYNPQEKSFFGRTAQRWGIAFAFYLVFYAVLALLFAACMGGLFYSLDQRKPTYILDKSLIGASPGLAFRPRPADGVTVKYNRENLTHYQDYVTELQDFLKPYTALKWLTPSCASNDSFGFPHAPCFYIKLNKIYGWEPEYYEDKSSFPEDMPADLVDYIQDADHPVKHKQIWVSCTQEKDNNTVIEYPWGRGMPNVYYPYLNQEAYQSPIVAVRLLPPVNTLVIIRCRAWAKNIVYNKSIKDPSGYTRISLYIEDNTATSEAVEED